MSEGVSHLLDIASLPPHALRRLLSSTAQIAADSASVANRLAGRCLVNLFYEPSTRTRASFEIAAGRLGMQVVNVSDQGSSVVKGESLLDTFRTLQAMGPDVLVIRHPDENAPHLLADAADPVHIINAGNGARAHPTQALLDAAVMLRHHGELERLRVVIAGDVAHSRVARSNHALLNALGVGELRIAAPGELMPPEGEFSGATRFTDLDDALDGADVVMMLRVQRERLRSLQVPEGAAYHADWGLSEKRLARAAKGAIVMHPGPINRGVEIEASVADGPQSVILEQVATGVAARMAVLLEIMEHE